MSDSGSDPRGQGAEDPTRRLAHRSPVDTPPPGAAPDLRALRGPGGDVDPSGLVEVLCADTVERWGRGERVPAEA
jgi:hypothetical protein